LAVKKQFGSSNKKSAQNPKKRMGGEGEGGSLKKDPIRTMITWGAVILAIFLGLRLLEQQERIKEVEVKYSVFLKLLTDPQVNIVKVKVTQVGLSRAELHGEVGDAAALAKLPDVKQPADTRFFRVNLPFVDSQMLAEWDRVGFAYTFEEEKVDWMGGLLGTLPWLLIMVFFWLFMIRQMNAGQRGIFSFGKSRAKLAPMDRPKNTFADAAGVDEAKAELEEIIEFLKDPKKFRRLGGKIPKGVLLLGPPGTGKTLLARCVAGEAGVPFLSMSGSDFVEMFVGVGASRVRDLFDTAKKSSPCIVFVDEIDAVGRQRGAGLGGGHDEREQTLNQMLVEMDGFEENSGVIMIAATNRPDVLDPALLRPGRFDRQIVVDVPDVKGREGILKVHVKEIPLAADVDLKTIARGTPGFVGADLRNLVNEAALMAARFGKDNVSMLDFEEAKDKVMMGVERKSMVLSEKERRITAYHEAGHAICNLYCGEADPLHKVTIIPRGRALGVTFSLPVEDKLSLSKNYLLDKVCLTMGGRIAEEIVFGVQTNGAYNDIKQITKIVRYMVCDVGMTEELGPLSYGEKDEQIFLGREIARHRDYSDRTAEEIDRLMRSIVDEQSRRARAILTEHHTELDRLALALLEHEMLDREEVMKVISGEKLEEAKKTRGNTGRKKPEPAATAESATPVSAAPSAPGESTGTAEPEKPAAPPA
jgi:cell division protease FtsH